MVVFNPLKKEIDIKIVYYGPALCGKTTNLQSVHVSLNPQQRGELVSLATRDDRTLFFDFLPIELDNIKGFKTRFHIYTVPGQVFYTLTRKAVLTGVDGIIFVADSQKEKMEENVESLDDLRENLRYYKKDVGSIPFVMQYNKRDLANILPLQEMERLLNPQHAPCFEACAISGKGVMETLTMCCKIVLKQIQDKSQSAQTTAVQDRAGAKPFSEQTKTDLPRITLVTSHADQAEAGADQRLSQKPSLSPAAPHDAARQKATDHTLPLEDKADWLEAVAGGNSRDGSIHGEPVLQEPEEFKPVNELLDKEPTIAFPEPELQINDALENTSREERRETVYGAKLAAPVDDARAGICLPNPAAEEGKRTCPRCSLKFKLNVKQCPICKVSLLPEAGEQEGEVCAGDPEADSVSRGAEAPGREKGASSEEHDGESNGKYLEIVSCGQPQKTSPTAIRVPLVMKINETAREIEVDLAINFGNVLLK